MKFSRKSLFLFLFFLIFFVDASFGSVICSSHLTKNIEIAGSRDLDLDPDIKLATYNLQDMVFNENTVKFKKDHENLKIIANIIEQEKINFLVLEEIQNREVLDLFNKEYLNNKYLSLVIDGNDQNRKIAFLIDKDLPIKVDIQTFSHLKTYNKLEKAELPLFSRDLPALLIRHTKASNTDPPSLIVLGTHFKSQRDYKTDIRSVLRRKEQVDAAANIIKTYEKHYPETAIIIAGDFNADIIGGKEFKSLFKNNFLMDGLNLNSIKLSSKERVTQTYHQFNGENFFNQMDAILFNQTAQKFHKKTYVYRYKDNRGEIKELPNSFQERSLNPSDHFPVITEINLRKILKGY